MGKYWGESDSEGEGCGAEDCQTPLSQFTTYFIIIAIDCFVNDRDGKYFEVYSSQTTLSIFMSCGSVGRASTIWQENARAIFFAPLARLSVQS